MKITKRRIYEVVTRSKASQNKVELTKLLELMSGRTVNVVLEIGVHQGHSLNLWQDAFYPDLLIGIEPNMASVQFDGLTNNALIIGGSSHDITTLKSVRSLLGKRKIDFLFIDGDHSFQGVKEDYNVYSSLLSPRGAVVLHDIVAESGVREFWSGIEDSLTNYNVIHHTGGTGCALIFK